MGLLTLLVEQDQVWIEHRYRQAENEWGVRFYEQLTDKIVLDSLDIKISVAGLYNQIEFENETTN